MSKSILEQCERPVDTRQRAAEGQPVPCYRCLAFRPETESGCFLIERGQAERPGFKRREVPDQTKLW